MKMAVWTILISLATLLWVSSGSALDSDLRCGSKLVSVGDYKYDVIRKCGEPAHVEVWEEVRIKGGPFRSAPISPDIEILRRSPLVKEYVTIEEWEYNFGQGSFIRYLKFENGRLTRITTGDYGY
jgi:hypothetical protein